MGRMSPRLKAKRGRFGADGFAPVLTIVAPLEGFEATTLVAFDFIGTAIDPESGDISAAITWSSNVDGAIGTGATVSAALTTLGAHVITATIVDGAFTITQTVNVTVVA